MNAEATIIASRSGNPVRIEVDYTPADLKEYRKIVARKVLRNAWPAWLGVCVLMVAAFATSLFVPTTPAPTPTPAPALTLRDWVEPWIPWVFVWIALFVILPRWLARGIARRSFAGTSSWNRRHVMAFDDNTIFITEPLSRHEYSWRAVFRHKETKHLFLLFLSEQSAILVPKRAFGPGQELDFRTMLARGAERRAPEQPGFQVLPVEPL